MLISDDNSEKGTIKSLKELEKTPTGILQRWEGEITAAEKELKPFYEQARQVVKRFIDDRDAISANNKWFNVFNTNVQILEANLYANIPTADVSRTFDDMDDDVARVGGIILQRCIQQDMQEPECDFDAMMKHCVSDRLIPGIGTAWLRLETETEDQEEVDENEEPLKEIKKQKVAIDYVYWEDFLWSPCRVWSERRWVGRRVPMTYDALVKRFGDEKANQIPLDYSNNKEDLESDAHTVMKRACIYEIWDREAKEVHWYGKGCSELLDTKPDPLGLEDFEPCPKPMFANLTTTACKPKPDFTMIKDQYNELDEVNNRISLLIIACKVVGVYDKSSDGIQRMLTEGYDNTLIPVDNWAMFAEKGGIKGSIDWLPLEQVIKALQQLQVSREQIKAQIYELTGISDIVRGNTKASETLGAQELKGKFAEVRMQKLQDEVTRFGEQILQIKGEILVKHFDPKILLKMSNIEKTPDRELAIPALNLLKSDSGMEWSITIRSDAMAQIDWTRQKTERSEFMTAVATFLQSASTVGQGAPQLIPLMLELLKFGVAGFRISKEIEGIFDKYIKEFTDELEKKKNAPPPPDPEKQKMEAEMAMKQQESQMKQQESQQKMQGDMVKAQNDLAVQKQKGETELQQQQQEYAMKIQAMQEELAMKEKEWMMKLDYEQKMYELKLQNMVKQETAKPKKEVGSND